MTNEMSNQGRDDEEVRVVCALCGASEETAGIDCVMSDEGEGPHDFVEVVPLDPAFIRQLEVHHEQGAQER